MKKVIIMLYCVLMVGTASAQEKLITIKGKITDSKTKEALPGVTVYVQGGVLHTQSNGDGNYVIKVPEKWSDHNLIFSTFGYSRDTTTVKAATKHADVKLKAATEIMLSEVTVSEYRPQTLIREAVAPIPQNYWSATTIGTFFYRDSRQLNGELYLFDEMVFDVLRVGYDKNNTLKKTHNSWKHPERRPIESNYKSILFSRLLVNDTAYIHQVTGGTGSSYLKYSDNDVLFDPVEIPNTTFYLSTSKRKQKMWEYDMQTFTDPDGVGHYIVTLSRESSLLGPSTDTVRLTITKGSLTITKVEQHSNTKMNKFFWPMNKMMEKVGIDSIYFDDHDVYTYDEVDGKMTLTSFNKHNVSTWFYNNSQWGDNEQLFVLDCQGVLTSQRMGDASFLDSNNIQSPVSIAVSDRQSGGLRYDDEFWEQYNYVPLEKDLLQKLNKRLKRIVN